MTLIDSSGNDSSDKNSGKNNDNNNDDDDGDEADDESNDGDYDDICTAGKDVAPPQTSFRFVRTDPKGHLRGG